MTRKILFILSCFTAAISNKNGNNSTDDNNSNNNNNNIPSCFRSVILEMELQIRKEVPSLHVILEHIRKTYCESIPHRPLKIKKMKGRRRRRKTYCGMEIRIKNYYKRFECPESASASEEMAQEFGRCSKKVE